MKRLRNEMKMEKRRLLKDKMLRAVYATSASFFCPLEGLKDMGVTENRKGPSVWAFSIVA